jgi:multicomponent Na+:H+ antiporter subunit D
VLLAHTGDSEAGEEPRAPRHRSLVLMALPAIALLALGLGLSFLPRLAGRAEHQAARFEDRPAYAAIVLRAEPPPPLRRAEPHHTSGASFLYGAASTLGALALAGCALARGGAAERARRRVTRAARRPVAGLHLLHSGHVGDYVAWLTAGAATLGGLCAVFLR